MGVTGGCYPALCRLKGAAAPVRAGVDEQSHRVSRGVCVVNLKAIMLVAGAVFASSFSSPTKFGAGNPADAADAIPPPPPQVVKVPEFVPVVNFSQFVLAMQTFAAENPPAARLAAEALSAKFTSDQISQKAAPKLEPREASVIITRPVVIASVPNLPSVPDPTGRPAKTLADPVKVATALPEEPSTKRRRHKSNTVASSRKRFEAPMGLGMVIDSAENAPPMSSLARKTKNDDR
jgi:hypothetical protein